MKAIITKYHGPTNFKGSRITASDEDGNRVTISYPHELSGEDVHRKAADALCEKMGWKGRLIGGSLKNGYVFVWDDAELIEALELAQATIERVNPKVHNSCGGTLEVIRTAIEKAKG